MLSPGHSRALMFFVFSVLLAAGCNRSDSRRAPNLPVAGIVDSNGAPDSVVESAAPASPVGITVSADDPNPADSVTYSLTDDAGGLFAIDPQTGVVEVNAGLDFETAAQHSIVATASSSDGSSIDLALVVQVVDNLAPDVNVIYPLDFARVEGATMPMRGTAVDPEGGAVSVEVTAGGVTIPASFDANGWIAQGVASTGMIEIVATDADGESVRLQKSYDAGLSLLAPVDMAMNAAGTHLLIVDRVQQSLLQFELSSRTLTVLSGEGAGLGSDFVAPVAVAVSSLDGMIYVADRDANALLTVDPGTGDRTVLSGGDLASLAEPYELEHDASDDSLLALPGPIRIQLADFSVVPLPAAGSTVTHALVADPSRNRVIAKIQAWTANGTQGLLELDLGANDSRGFPDAPLSPDEPIRAAGDIARAADTFFVVDADADALVKVDALTAERTVLSSAMVGSGPTFFSPRALVLTADLSHAYVLDFGLAGILRVNLATGDRELVLDTRLGEAPWVTAGRMVLDSSSNRLYVTDHLDNESELFEAWQSTVMRIDLTSGSREVFSGRGQGGGSAEIQLMGGLAIDGSGDLFAVEQESDERSLVRIDGVSGDRAVVSSQQVGTGALPFAGAYDLALGQNDSVAWVVDVGRFGSSDELHEIDLANGDRTLLATLNMASTQVFGFAYDPPNDRYLLASRADQRIQAFTVQPRNIVDLSGIARTNNVIGSGTLFQSANDVLLTAEPEVVYVPDRELGVFRVNLTTGDRELVVDRSVGLSIGAPLQVAQPDPATLFILSSDGAVYHTELSSGHRVLISN